MAKKKTKLKSKNTKNFKIIFVLASILFGILAIFMMFLPFVESTTPSRIGNGEIPIPIPSFFMNITGFSLAFIGDYNYGIVGDDSVNVLQLDEKSIGVLITFIFLLVGILLSLIYLIFSNTNKFSTFKKIIGGSSMAMFLISGIMFFLTIIISKDVFTLTFGNSSSDFTRYLTLGVGAILSGSFSIVSATFIGAATILKLKK